MLRKSYSVRLTGSLTVKVTRWRHLSLREMGLPCIFALLSHLLTAACWKQELSTNIGIEFGNSNWGPPSVMFPIVGDLRSALRNVIPIL